MGTGPSRGGTARYYRTFPRTKSRPASSPNVSAQHRTHRHLHRLCGTDQGCDCDYCASGACKTDDLYSNHNALGDRVMCKRVDGQDFKYECAKGTCTKCGWFEKHQTTFTRALARKLVLDADLKVAPQAEQKDKGVLKSAAKFGILPGMTPSTVDGVKILTKTGWLEEIAEQEGKHCAFVFDTEQLRAGLGAFAKCPRTQDDGDATFPFRFYGKEKQGRAHN